MSETKRGGAGRGQGRKPIAEGQETVTVSLRMTKAQRTRLTRLGGAEWVRNQIEGATMFYITSSEYVGPNLDERLNSHEYRIQTWEPETNMSHAVRTDGWLGTTNDVAAYAHGEFETEEAARAEVERLLADTGYRELDCDDPGSIDDGEELYYTARYAVGRYETWGREGTSNWCYEGVNADVTADTTDERIKELVAEYEGAANGEGFSLDLRTVERDIEARRKELRVEREESSD